MVWEKKSKGVRKRILNLKIKKGVTRLGRGSSI